MERKFQNSQESQMSQNTKSLYLEVLTYLQHIDTPPSTKPQEPADLNTEKQSSSLRNGNASQKCFRALKEA